MNELIIKNTKWPVVTSLFTVKKAHCLPTYMFFPFTVTRTREQNNIEAAFNNVHGAQRIKIAHTVSGLLIIFVT